MPPFILAKQESPLRSRQRATCVFLVTCLLPGATLAQEIPKNEYLSHLSLKYPRLVRQVEANRTFAIYGDNSAPSYRDVEPRDGIDDKRGLLLRQLGKRFSPYLVLNTTEVPLDFKHFMDKQGAFKLHIDTWNLAESPKDIIQEETIDFNALLAKPCNGDSGAAEYPLGDDCRLRALLDEFHPDHPTAERFNKAAVDARRDDFKVVYWDFPGHDPKTWKEEYENQFSGELPLDYRGATKVYLHPFIEEVQSNNQGTLGYEFVLQYWLFYPANDGANNHEGDWEHISVIVARRSQVTRLQQADDIQQILAGEGSQEGDSDPLVIKRVDYYFHHKVWVVDYARPNVYQSREAWEAESNSLTKERAHENKIWSLIRQRAYRDKAETVLNTHPIGFIGANSKGLELLMAFPGGKNQDSHGTYPFPGFYKNVAPAGAAEQISAPFNYHDYFEKPEKRKTAVERGYVETFQDGDNVEIVPDWERIIDLVRDEPAVRREWSWLVLPVRWGYPAANSPLAGAVEHADFGNAAPYGPSLNKGWNRAGASAGFSQYAPHRFTSWFALGLADNFQNSWGFLNIVVPVFTMLPPFDMLFRLVAAPVRMVGDRQPTFLDKKDIPFRFLSLLGGKTTQNMGNEFADLLLADNLVTQLVDEMSLSDSVTAFETGRSVETAVSPFIGINFHVGSTLTTENALWHLDSEILVDLAIPATTETHKIRSQLDFWEYAGTLRYNLAAGRFQPYLKFGYGVSWFRLVETSLDGNELADPNSEWITTFNWHWGFGIEAVLIQSYGSLPGGIDVGLQLDFLRFSQSLGLDQVINPVSLASFTSQGNANQSTTREVVNLALTVSF